MELTVYDIIKQPVLSEAAYKKNRDLKQLILIVHPDATKTQIAQAMKKLFNVEVEKVRTYMRPDKTRRVGKYRRQVVSRDRQKRAVITLKEGYNLDIFGQAQQEVAA